MTKTPKDVGASVRARLLHLARERSHQGLANELIEPIAANTNAGEDVVRRRARLGGLLSYYHREAA